MGGLHDHPLGAVKRRKWEMSAGAISNFNSTSIPSPEHLSLVTHGFLRDHWNDFVSSVSRSLGLGREICRLPNQR